MLHEQWRAVAAAGGDALALADLADGAHWSFAALAAAAETGSPEAPVSFVRGQRGSFVLEVLRAWRSGRVVCPLEDGPPAPALPPPPAGIAHLKLTSGSTARPRWVAFTATQLAADAAQIVRTMGLRPDWPNVGAISLAHSYGFSNLVLPLLLHGVPLVLAASALPAAVREAIAFAGACTLPGVPALWRAWHEAEALTGDIRLALSAGAPLPLALELQILERRALKVHNFYGATECGGIAFDATTAPRTDPALAGTPLAGVALSCDDAGCLVVTSAAAGTGYWPDPQAALSGDGRFHTSDLAELRAGSVYLRGRAGDLIQVAGRKVAPELIEEALRRHPGVRECLVFGAPDAGAGGRGERIVAVVAGDAAPADLRRHLLGLLPAWQVPREWRIEPELAADGRGKLSRAAWRERYTGPV